MFQRFDRDTDYSENEKKLFTQVGLDYLMGNVSAIGIMKILAEKCFIDQRDDHVAAATRNGLRAINNHKPFRMTSEFEELIKV